MPKTTITLNPGSALKFVELVEHLSKATHLSIPATIQFIFEQPILIKAFKRELK